MDIVRKILLGWFMFLLIPIGPWLGTVVARHYDLNQVLWAFVITPLAMSVLLIGSSATVVRVNQG